MKKRNMGFKNEGFSLVEVSIVISIGIILATTLALLVNMHTQALEVIKKSKFLYEEAPTVGVVFKKTVGQANDYRVYRTTADAVRETGEATGAVGTRSLKGNAVKLEYRNQINQNLTHFAVIGMSSSGGKDILGYYNENAAGNLYPANPDWILIEAPSGKITATFDLTGGVLTLTIVGPNYETVTYGATKE